MPILLFSYHFKHTDLTLKRHIDRNEFLNWVQRFKHLVISWWKKKEDNLFIMSVFWSYYLNFVKINCGLLHYFPHFFHLFLHLFPCYGLAIIDGMYSFHLVSGLGYVTCFGWWHMSKSHSLYSKCKPWRSHMFLLVLFSFWQIMEII